MWAGRFGCRFYEAGLVGIQAYWPVPRAGPGD